MGHAQEGLTSASDTPKKGESAHAGKPVVASIQALRAAAVAGVALNHYFPALLSGGFIGVDIFFVISGFLISSHLMAELERGDLDFVRFYLRRARRLLPASMVVLAVTAAVAYRVLPAAWQESGLRDVAAAAAYVINWRLAANAVNYFADSGVAPPVNHFWSLSVEEQFYLVWPAMLYAAPRIAARATGRDFGRLAPGAIGWLLAGLAIASFLLATLALQQQRAAAYFLTYARAWEFAAGGLAGLALRRFPDFLRAAWCKPAILAAWLTLIGAMATLTARSDVPGAAAAPAVLATAIILVVGDGHGSRLAHAIVSLSPVQWLGGISYSFYLWHWPILALAPFAFGVETIGLPGLVALLAVSLALSALTKRHVEDRFRFPPARASEPSGGGVPALAGYLALSLGLAAGLWASATVVEGKSARVGRLLYELSMRPGPCFGARATEPGAACPASHVLADRNFVLQNWKTQVGFLPNGWYCQNKPGDPVLAPCGFGAPDKTAMRHIALFGDSHAGMWESAFAMFAEAAGLRFHSFVASSCPISADDHSIATYLKPEWRQGCLSWRKAASAAILADTRIDTIVIADNAYNQKVVSDADVWSEDDGRGLAALVRAFRAAGKRVILIDDVPTLPHNVSECLARAHSDDDPCSVDQAKIAALTPIGRAATLLAADEADYVDFKNVFCDGKLCHAIIGGIPAYMDSDHITAPFSRSLAPRLEKTILRQDVGARR